MHSSAIFPFLLQKLRLKSDAFSSIHYHSMWSRRQLKNPKSDSFYFTDTTDSHLGCLLRLKTLLGLNVPIYKTENKQQTSRLSMKGRNVSLMHLHWSLAHSKHYRTVTISIVTEEPRDNDAMCIWTCLGECTPMCKYRQPIKGKAFIFK